MILLESIYKSAEALGADFSSPAEIPSQLQSAPEFIREYHQNFSWPKGQVFTGVNMHFGEDIYHIALFGERITLVDWLDDFDDHDDEIEAGNQYAFGSTGGGNYALLLKEIEPNPNNPMVYRLDHTATYDASPICDLLEFFTKLVPSE